MEISQLIEAIRKVKLLDCPNTLIMAPEVYRLFKAYQIKQSWKKAWRAARVLGFTHLGAKEAFTFYLRIKNRCIRIKP